MSAGFQGRRPSRNVDKNGLTTTDRTAIHAAAEANGILHVEVFGSMARGDARADSDLDLLVDLAHGRNLFDLIGFKQAVEDALGVRVDVVSRRSIHPLMRDRILAEAVPV